MILVLLVAITIAVDILMSAFIGNHMEDPRT